MGWVIVAAARMFVDFEPPRKRPSTLASYLDPSKEDEEEDDEEDDEKDAIRPPELD